MRTNDHIIEEIIRLFTSIDFNKTKEILNENDKDALFSYIKEEFLNINEYKELISEIKFDKEDLLEAIYQILILINEDEAKSNSLNKTNKLIEYASIYGFTWPNSRSCFNKIIEEFKELNIAVENNDTINIQEEIGDLIFTLQCYSNLKGYNLNNIIKKANEKFEKRFKKVLEIAKNKNINLDKASSETKEKFWNIAKK